jgi:predicted acylesterase/phospholipase RssA
MPNQASPPRGEAVCFTAGIKGAAFSAGVIHAYLASDRPPPKVAAGISTGALSAAALERCYRELPPDAPPPEREIRRWGWFRRYLDAITWEPLDVIWNAIPDPVDFFADKPPVSDLSADALPPQLKKEEAEARQNYYRLVKLGLWLAGLRISVRDISRTLISRVRFKEHYGYPNLERVRFCAGLTWIVLKVVLHLCFSPQFTVERQKWTGGRRFPRPLFGWPAWFVGVGVVGIEAGLILRIPVHYLRPLVARLRYVSRLGGEVSHRTPHFLKALAYYDVWLFSVSAIVVTLGLLVLFRFQVGGAIRHLLTELGVVRGLLHRYTLHRRLFGLFCERPGDQEGPVVGSPSEFGHPAPFPGSMHLLLVAAPLQEIKDLNNQQLWAAPGTPIVNALLAALAVPGLFPPLQLTKPAQIDQWLSKRCRNTHLTRLDLIDGAAVRQNPLPALFSWLDGHPEVANELCGEGLSDIGIHLVYNVPTEPYQQEPGEEPPERVNIVTAALTSLELSRRRDSKLECRQTNFVSEMELWVRTMENLQPQRAAGVAASASMSSTSSTTPVSSIEAPAEEAAASSSRAFPIFVDEIAPERDIKFENYLAPDRKDLLKSAACGCLRSMETLYSERLRLLQASQPIDCADLLRQVSPDRSRFISQEAPGLREVCAACTRKLAYRSAHEEPPAPVQPALSFPHLNAAQPRVVFLASGGVFRGAFHIGVIGAMQAAGIRPNLIVGASVGSLMGGALGAISTLERSAGWDLLAHLCLTFLHVDKRVALTKTLKNAAKQLGVRTKNVNLSPAQLRRMVRRGGYAVAGAPPALIDAISTAFLIPLEETSKIASQFVAGHTTQAVKEFLQSVRKETLHRLDIQNALMGTSLIENAARTLLGHGRPGIDLGTKQPYHDTDRPHRSISFFGTTSDLNRRRPLLLPRDIGDLDSPGYDFVKAALSSSAFPAVFSPRQEAEVLAGKGATNVLFSDGGMFDNLPFFPAIEVLSSLQKQWRGPLGDTPLQSLQRRYSQPDLFIAAALESAGDASADAEDILEINQRARSLKVNIKLNSFQRTSSLVDSQIERLLQFSAGKDLPEGLPKFMDEAVPAGVLKIVPTDRKHLNSTFAFCSALGLRRDVVTTSIADGCFQTLKSLLPAQIDADPLLQRTVQSLQNDGKILRVLANDSKKVKADGIHCPFFQVNAQRFECPFVSSARCYKGDANQSDAEKRAAVSELRGVYKTCTGDGAHRSLAQAGSLAQAATQPRPSASNATLR